MTEMVYATYALYIDWNNDGDYGDAGETVTADWIGSNISRGFSNPLARVAKVGTMDFTLLNTNQEYSPESVANVLPRRPVRLTMTYDGDTVTLYEGMLDSINPSYAASDPLKYAGFACVDDMDRLDRFEGDIAILTNTHANDVIEDVVAAVYTPTATDYDAGINLYPVASDRWTGSTRGIVNIAGTGGSTVVQEVRASDKILDAATGDWGHFYIAKDGTPTFRNRHKMPFDSTTVLTLNETQSAVRYEKSTQPILNHISVTCYPRKIGQTNEVLGRIDQTTPPIIEDGESITLEVRFQDPVNNAVTLGGKDVITPVASTDYECTDDEPGEGTDETANVSVSMTAYGDYAEIELTNSAGHAVFVQKLQVRGIAVRSWQAVTVTAEDSTSQDDYGRRSLAIDAALMSNPIHAQNLADWLLDYYKDPQPIVSVTFSANANATLMEAARDLELLDRVVLTDTQTGLSSDVFFVYGITHSIPAAHQHTVTLDLMQAYDYVDGPFTIGTSQLDGADVFVY